MTFSNTIDIQTCFHWHFERHFMRFNDLSTCVFNAEEYDFKYINTKLHITQDVHWFLKYKMEKWHITWMMCAADFLKQRIGLECRSCQGQAAETEMASFSLFGEKINFWRTSLVGFDSLYLKLKLFVKEFSDRYILKLGTKGRSHLRKIFLKRERP